MEVKEGRLKLYLRKYSPPHFRENLCSTSTLDNKRFLTEFPPCCFVLFHCTCFPLPPSFITPSAPRPKPYQRLNRWWDVWRGNMLLITDRFDDLLSTRLISVFCGFKSVNCSSTNVCLWVSWKNLNNAALCRMPLIPDNILISDSGFENVNAFSRVAPHSHQTAENSGAYVQHTEGERARHMTSHTNMMTYS